MSITSFLKTEAVLSTSKSKNHGRRSQVFKCPYLNRIWAAKRNIRSSLPAAGCWRDLSNTNLVEVVDGGDVTRRRHGVRVSRRRRRRRWRHSLLVVQSTSGHVTRWSAVASRPRSARATVRVLGVGKVLVLGRQQGAIDAAHLQVYNADGTGSPSDPRIQRPGDPVDPVIVFYNELQMSTTYAWWSILRPKNF